MENESILEVYEKEINKFYDNNEIDISNAQLEPLTENCENFLRFVMSNDWKNNSIHEHLVKTLLVYMLENSENAKE